METEIKRIKLPVGDNTIEVTPTKSQEEIALEQANAEKEVAAKAAADLLAQQELDKKSIPDSTVVEEGDPIEGSTIEFTDGLIGTVDKDGNLVGPDGVILKTKAETIALFKENETPADSTTTEDYIKLVQAQTNLIITDDAGAPITYDNTVDGVAKYTEDIYQSGIELGKQQYEQDLLSQYPIVKDIITHLQLNGTIEGFTNKVDYKKIAISETDESQWMSIYLQAAIKKGIPESEAANYANYLKEDGKLKAAATDSLKYLNDAKARDEQAAAKMIEDQDAIEKADNEKYWNNVKGIVDAGKFKLDNDEYVIPKVMRVKDELGKVVTKTPTDFWNYINTSKRYNIGGQLINMTEYEYELRQAESKRNVNTDVFEALKKFLKQDQAQIIKAQINTAATKKVIKLTSKSGAIGVSTDQTGKAIKLVLPIPQS